MTPNEPVLVAWRVCASSSEYGSSTVCPDRGSLEEAEEELLQVMGDPETVGIYDVFEILETTVRVVQRRTCRPLE